MPVPALKQLSILTLILALSACASQDQTQVSNAVTAPLNDLNLVHADIPALLVETQKQPYAVPENKSCDALLVQIIDLDAVLGPDLDANETSGKPSLIERGSKEAKKAAVNALRSTTESIIPYRGWVRKLSGAERYSNKVAAAITAGTIRRAFLKGMMVSQGCE